MKVPGQRSSFHICDILDLNNPSDTKTNSNHNNNNNNSTSNNNNHSTSGEYFQIFFFHFLFIVFFVKLTTWWQKEAIMWNLKFIWKNCRLFTSAISASTSRWSNHKFKWFDCIDGIIEWYIIGRHSSRIDYSVTSTATTTISTHTKLK